MSLQNSHQISEFKVLLKKGADGTGIKDIELTGSSGIVDTYTITLTNDDKYIFTVTNGSSIASIEKTATVGNVDTYTITLTNGDTSTFTVTNGTGSTASDIDYDNTTSGLLATKVQGAIDEVNEKTNTLTTTKANKSDLTDIVESGTTASQAISAGTYFYLDGTLVQAKTDIASGATFTLNTNYVTLPKGAMGYSCKIPDYSNAGNEIDFTSSKTHTATQDCLFVFHVMANSSANVYIKINNKSLLNAPYLNNTSTSTVTTNIIISIPFCFPMKKGDVLTITYSTASGFNPPSEIRGHEIPFYS